MRDGCLKKTRRKRRRKRGDELELGRLFAGLLDHAFPDVIHGEMVERRISILEGEASLVRRAGPRNVWTVIVVISVPGISDLTSPSMWGPFTRPVV